MKDGKMISNLRRNYGEQTLSEDDMKADPLDQFKEWLEVMLSSVEHDPTAMVLSTVDAQGVPDSRVLLLKGVEQGGFAFYTNYESSKACQLNHNPHAALNFYWPSVVRQVRVRGCVQRVARAQSKAYFASRPKASQISAIASPQSQEIANRASLLKLVENEALKHAEQSIDCPENWGGYLLIPDEIEFWQGRDDRLHDRIHYFKQQGQWRSRRLAP
jgi:pyridoxamine 5'-phosphate oxidase